MFLTWSSNRRFIDVSTIPQKNLNAPAEEDFARELIQGFSKKPAKEHDILS
jgi:hypothetical protein